MDSTAFVYHAAAGDKCVLFFDVQSRPDMHVAILWAVKLAHSLSKAWNHMDNISINQSINQISFMCHTTSKAYETQHLYINIKINRNKVGSSATGRNVYNKGGSVVRCSKDYKE